MSFALDLPFPPSSLSPLPTLPFSDMLCHPLALYREWKMPSELILMQMKNVNYFRAWAKKANCARTRNSSNMNMNTNVNMSATLDKKTERETDREIKSERERTDVVNFELVQLQFLQPHLTFVCSSLNEPEIEVASSNKSGKYSQNIKNSSSGEIKKKTYKVQNVFKI